MCYNLTSWSPDCGCACPSEDLTYVVLAADGKAAVSDVIPSYRGELDTVIKADKANCHLSGTALYWSG